MMTDTGAFTFNSNNPEIYNIVSELIKKGINKDEIYNNVYNNFTADRFRLMGYALNEKMKIYPEYGTALITLSLGELNRYHYKTGDTEGFVNIPLSIEGIVFSVFIKEDTDKIKMSFRSRGTFPVNQVASSYFNGGGHLNAAGGESYVSMAETIEKFESLLPLYKETLISD
jgi:phosphoesterase RecJ-like protein